MVVFARVAILLFALLLSVCLALPSSFPSSSSPGADDGSASDHSHGHGDSSNGDPNTSSDCHAWTETKQLHGTKLTNPKNGAWQNSGGWVLNPHSADISIPGSVYKYVYKFYGKGGGLIGQYAVDAYTAPFSCMVTSASVKNGNVGHIDFYYTY